MAQSSSEYLRSLLKTADLSKDILPSGKPEFKAADLNKLDNMLNNLNADLFHGVDSEKNGEKLSNDRRVHLEVLVPLETVYF